MHGNPWLYRSAALDSATELDLQQLSDFGITQVVDLRSSVERPVVKHAFPVTNLPLYSENEQLPIRGKLTEVYIDRLENAGPQFVAVAQAIARNFGITLVHCKVGKDRTGLVVALVSLAVGMSAQTVIEDYARSEVEVRKHREDRIYRKLTQQDLSSKDFQLSVELQLTSPMKVMRAVIDWLQINYGGAAEYLRFHGLADDDINRLQMLYCARQPETDPTRSSQAQPIPQGGDLR